MIPLEALNYLLENKRRHWLEGDRSNECLEIIAKALKRLAIVDLNEEERIENKKKAKALEIIKETLPIKEEDFFYDKETDTYFFIGYKVPKEKYDLLKEVML